MKRAMQKDFSWDLSAQKYMRCYEWAMQMKQK
jgi:glycogen synthase